MMNDFHGFIILVLVQPRTYLLDGLQPPESLFIYNTHSKVRRRRKRADIYNFVCSTLFPSFLYTHTHVVYGARGGCCCNGGTGREKRRDLKIYYTTYIHTILRSFFKRQRRGGGGDGQKPRTITATLQRWQLQ